MHLTRRALGFAVSAKGNKLTCVRNASKQAVSPGIPLAVQSNTAFKGFLAVNLPSVSQRPIVASVQAPYVPDFWNSARSKPDAPLEPELPKVHVIGGSATHYDGGPTRNLQEDSSSTVQARDLQPNNNLGFWADFWESLGLPRSFSLRRSLSEAGDLSAQASNGGPQPQSRPLTDNERKGLYILLALVGASWLVGTLVKRPTVVADKHST